MGLFQHKCTCATTYMCVSSDYVLTSYCVCWLLLNCTWDAQIHWPKQLRETELTNVHKLVRYIRWNAQKILESRSPDIKAVDLAWSRVLSFFIHVHTCRWQIYNFVWVCVCVCACVCIYTSPKAAQLQWAFDAQSIFRKVEIWKLVMMSFQGFRKNETRT